jgi:hypothetical protein
MGVPLIALISLRCATDIESPSGPENTDPIANDDQATTSQGVPTTVTVTANDSDPDGNQIQLVRATLETSVPGGSITTNPDNGTITVDPGPSFVGTIEVLYDIVDDGFPPGFATGTLLVTVVAGNAPVAVDDQATTERGVPVVVDVLANDSDSDGGTLTVADPVFLGAQPAGSSVQVNEDQTLTIDPGPGFSGTLQVGYTVRDPTGLAASGRVTVTVVAPAPATSVRLDIVDDSGGPLGGAAAAFRIGQGAWMPLSETSPGRFDVDVPEGESQWGVTARVGDNSQTIEATTDEATSARMTFRNPSVMRVDFAFLWDGVDNLGNGVLGVLLHGLTGFVGSGGGANGASTIPQYPANQQDFLLIATDDGIPVGVDIVRDVTPMQGGTIDFSFTAAYQGGSMAVDPFSVPSGSSGSFLIAYTTGWGVAPVGSGTNTGGVAYTFPASQQDPAMDFYLARGAASTTGATSIHTMVTHPPAPAGFAQFAVPDDFFSTSPPVASANPTFTGLQSNAPNHQMFNLTLGRSGPGPAITRSYTLTQGWLDLSLAPAPATALISELATGYTVSDPTGLPGFEDFGFDSGNSVTWTVTQMSSNVTISDMFGARIVTGVPLIDGLSQTTRTAAGVYIVP